MSLTQVFDAAVPPATAPAGCGAVAGYTGRRGFTPHVWTPAEWNRFTGLGMLPIWVPDLTQHPHEEAAAMCNTAGALGWTPHLPAAETRAIIVDFETASGETDRRWWAQCSDAIHVNGFAGVAYGSESTVFDLAASWVWLAAWDGHPALGQGQTVVAHQYQAGVPSGGSTVDFSVMSPWLAARCGRGPRRG